MSISILPHLKSQRQDFEFYPTTNEIIGALTRDLKKQSYKLERGNHSFLDIGAGNGKVLEAVRLADDNIRELYAIEKSPILCGQLDANIMVVGTEFHEQSLLSKNVGITFSNPPYSEFEPWCVKIIRESCSRFVYLVIPQRWENSKPIADALKFRNAKHHVIGNFDFEDSEDRAARAKVHLVRVELSGEEDDAFDRFFAEQFAPLIEKSKPKDKRDAYDRLADESRGRKEFNSLVVGEDYPTALVNLYNQEMARVQKNYELVCQLDPELLEEFDVTVEKVRKCLKDRLEGLRNVYWHELFSRMAPITNRLTSRSRNNLLETLRRHAHVDFTVGNIHAIVVWCIKNANRYIDSQLCSVYDKMIEHANVRLYKSNLKPFKFDRWRYNGEADNSTHFMLEYRIVMHSCGGLKSGSYSWEKGLDDRAGEFLGDLLTIARNLGFNCDTTDRRIYSFGPKEWDSSAQEFCTTNQKREVGDRVKGVGVIKEKHRLESGAWQYHIGDQWYHENCLPGETLFEVRAFKNGNMHLRLNQRFALALNVEYGRLKGWGHSGAEAAEEMGDPDAAAFFKTNLQLCESTALLLK